MTVSQADKAKKFRALHEAPGSFVIPNPWDGGSARVLAGLGFEALATSSGAKAGVLGKRDGKVSREEALANAKQIVEACDLPVAADLEKGFGDAPDAAAETIRQAAGIGLVGGSIHGRQGQAAVRCRGGRCARGGRGQGGAGAAVSLRAHGARRGILARPRRPRRRHQAPEGL
jgi:2-methylisocitrate lyase-like PEP mutase family enzyme